MSENPLVSIVVITYNSAKYVVETLESAKDQTYENIELIISDDGSSDDTVEICKAWIEKNKNRFVHAELLTVTKNTGIPANCNRGVKASSGEWIKLIAGDDILISSCIENNIKYTSQNPEIKILFSQIQEFKVSNEEKIFGELSPNSTNKDFFYKEAKEQYNLLLLRCYVGNTPSSFIRKSIFFEIGFFDEEFPLIEDYPFWLILTMNNINLYLMSIPTVNYRNHEESVYNGAMAKSKLVDIEYLRNEQMRIKYIYPQYTWFGVWYSKSVFTFSKLFKNAENTRLNFLLRNYINPFTYLFYLLRFFYTNEKIFLKKEYR